MAEYWCDLDSLVAGTGTKTSPYTEAQADDLIDGASGSFSDGDIVRFKGDYSLAATLGLFSSAIAANVTFKPWDDGAMWKLQSTGGWGVAMASLNLYGTTIIENAVIYNGYVQDSRNNYHFKNCVFYNSFVIMPNSGNYGLSNYRFDGCSFINCAAEIDDYTAGHLDNIHFNDCSFINSTLQDLTDAGTVTINSCFFDQTSTYNIDYCDLTETDNDETWTHTATVPTWATVSADTLDFSLWNLPITALLRQDEWEDNEYENGFSTSTRYGPGAFYFPALAITANPESGTFPLTVNFSCPEFDGATKYEWFMGDGTYLYDFSPEYIYQMSGEFTVTLTVSGPDGSWTLETVTITVFEYDYSGGINLSYTDRCLRFALPQRISQGVGWAFYDDVNQGVVTYGFPFPAGVAGCCTIEDANLKPRVLVMDSRTFRIMELGKVDTWVDAVDEYSGGSEVESEIIFPEHMPPIGAAAKLKHSQSHLKFKPWFKEYAGASGYNASGYRSAWEVDLFIRQDALPADAAITEKVPYLGQLVYDRHLVSEYLQEGCKVRGAPWRLPYAQMWYEQIDIAAAPPKKLMTEMSYSNELSGPFFWLSRDINPILERASVNVMSGSYASTVTGPDGRANSAIGMGASDSLSIAVTSQSGDMTLSLWVKSPTLPITLFDFSTGGLQVILSTGSIRWLDGSNDISFSLSSGFGTWALITLVKDGDNLICYENGSLVNTALMTDGNITYGGTLTIADGSVNIFDIRGLSAALSAAVPEYLYNDVVQNNGNATCPVF